MNTPQFLTHLLRHAWLWPLEFWLRPLTILRRINDGNEWAEIFVALLGGGLWGAVVGTVFWLANGDTENIWVMMLAFTGRFGLTISLIPVFIVGTVYAYAVGITFAIKFVSAGAYLSGALSALLDLWPALTNPNLLYPLALYFIIILSSYNDDEAKTKGGRSYWAATIVSAVVFSIVSARFFRSIPVEQIHEWGIILLVYLGMEANFRFMEENFRFAAEKMKKISLNKQADFLKKFYFTSLLLVLGTMLGAFLSPSQLSEKLQILAIYLAIAPVIWTGLPFYPLTALIAVWQYRHHQVNSFTTEIFELTVPFRWQTFAYPLPRLRSYLFNLATQHNVSIALKAIRHLRDWSLQIRASSQAANQLATHRETAIAFCGEVAIQTNSATLLPLSLTGQIGRAVAVLAKQQEKEDEQGLLLWVDKFPKEETSPQSPRWLPLLGNFGFKSHPSKHDWLPQFKTTRQAPLADRIAYAQQQLQGCTDYQGYDHFQQFLTLLKQYAQVQTVEEILALPSVSADLTNPWLAGGNLILQDLATIKPDLADYLQLQSPAARREVLEKQLNGLDRIVAQWQNQEELPGYWRAIGQELVTCWQTSLNQEFLQAYDQLQLTVELPTTSLLVGYQPLILRINNFSNVIAKAVCVEVEDTDGFFWTSNQVKYSSLLEGNHHAELRLEYRIDYPGRYGLRGELRATHYSTEQPFKWPFSFELTVADAGHVYQEFNGQPYETGAGIGDDRTFVGRGDLFAWLLNRWRQPDSKPTIVLIGQRRIGKTSLLHKIQRAGGEQTSLIPLFIDVQGISSEYDFLTTACHKMATALSLSLPSLDRQEPYVDFKQFLAQLTTPLTGRRFLLMLDEAEKIPSGRLGDRLPDFLRSLMQSPEYPTVLLFCGTQALQRTAWNYSSILFNTAQFKMVSYLSKEESQELLQKPAKDLLEFDLQVLDTAYDWTRGQPLLLQSIGAIVIDQFNQTVRNDKPRSNYVNYNDLEQAVETLVKSQNNAAFVEHWKNNDAATHRVLSTLAWCLDDTYPQIDFEGLLRKMKDARLNLAQRKEVFDIVQRLVEEEILEKMELTYRFCVPLYRRWIAWRWDIRRVKEEGI